MLVLYFTEILRALLDLNQLFLIQLSTQIFQTNKKSEVPVKLSVPFYYNSMSLPSMNIITKVKTVYEK